MWYLKLNLDEAHATYAFYVPYYLLPCILNFFFFFAAVVFILGLIKIFYFYLFSFYFYPALLRGYSWLYVRATPSGVSGSMWCLGKPRHPTCPASAQFFELFFWHEIRCLSLDYLLLSISFTLVSYSIGAAGGCFQIQLRESLIGLTFSFCGKYFCGSSTL